jgi:hypothetical protein
VLRLLLSLTLAVLLAATGAASAAHGLVEEEAGHHAMEEHGDGDPHAASVEECCDAVGPAGGGCLIDAALSNGLPVRPLPVSTLDLVSMAPVMSRGLAAPVPTGPPKV